MSHSAQGGTSLVEVAPVAPPAQVGQLVTIAASPPTKGEHAEQTLDDDDAEPSEKLFMHKTVSVLMYVVAGLLVVPMFVIFLQTWTCGFPMGTWKLNEASGQCTQIDCWGGPHLILLVLSSVFCLGLVYVAGLGFTTRQRDDEVCLSRMPVHLQALRRVALELQVRHGVVLCDAGSHVIVSWF